MLLMPALLCHKELPSSRIMAYEWTRVTQSEDCLGNNITVLSFYLRDQPIGSVSWVSLEILQLNSGNRGQVTEGVCAL